MGAAPAEGVPDFFDGAALEPLALEAERLELARALAHPAVHGKGEAHLGPVPDGAGQSPPEGIEKQRLGTRAIELERGRQRQHVLDEPVIEIRHARLDGVGHAHDVGVAEKLVTEVVGELESRQRLPQGAAGRRRQRAPRVSQLAGLQAPSLYSQEPARLRRGEEAADEQVDCRSRGRLEVWRPIEAVPAEPGAGRREP